MNVRRISRLGQVKVYTGKCFRLFWNENQWKNLISTIFIIILISMVTSKEMFTDFSQTRKGSFAIICACIWIGLFNSIQSICHERAIIKREHRTGLHITSYIAAHVIYEFVLCAAETLIVFAATVLKNGSHLPDQGLIFSMYIDLYITFFLVVFSSDMLAMIVSCAVKQEKTAMTVMPFILIIQLIMSGMIFELEGYAEKISTITLSRWGLDAVMSISNTTDTVKQGYILSGLEDCSATAGNLKHLWMILIAFSLVYIIVSILLLEGVDRDKR